MNNIESLVEHAKLLSEKLNERSNKIRQIEAILTKCNIFMPFNYELEVDDSMEPKITWSFAWDICKSAKRFRWLLVEECCNNRQSKPFIESKLILRDHFFEKIDPFIKEFKKNLEHK